MGQVNRPSNLLDRMRAMEAELAAIRKRVGLGNASISAGDLTIQNGGSVRVVHPNGTVVAKIGELGVLNGVDVWGIEFMRASNGAETFFSYSSEDGSVEFSGMRDLAGTIVMSDDGVSGHGLATPYLSSGMFPSFNNEFLALLPATASSTFVGLWEGYIPISHPKLRVMAFVGATDGATSGECRITMDDQAVGGTGTVTNGGGQFLNQVLDVPGWGDSVPYLHEVHVTVQARKTGGSGKIIAVPYSVYGKQS